MGIPSLKMYSVKRKELVKKIDTYTSLAYEAMMLNNWLEYKDLNRIILQLRRELAEMDGTVPNNE